MSKHMLVVSAELVNIVLLELRPDDNNVILHCFKVVCEGCGWVNGKEVYIRLDVHEDPLRQPRGIFRKSVKCEGCKLQGSIELVPGHGHHLEQNHCNDVPLMLFDCHRMRPVQYSLTGGWSAITTSGRRIINIEFTGYHRGVYEAEIDGEHIAIRMETKFLPYSG